MNNIAFYDLHTDILTANKKISDLIKEIKNNQKLGYKSINAIYKGDLTLENALKKAKIATQNKLGIAFEDCSYGCFASPDFGENFDSEQLEILVNNLTVFNPLYLSLCWNGENAFASGSKSFGGLKPAGKTFIKKLNAKNAVIDTAHANLQSFFEIAENAKKVICSHTAFCSVFPHVRNLTDEQIKLIISRGGIIGLLSVGHFLTGAKRSISAYENAFYEHIDWFLQKFGAKNLCIATDFYGSDAPVFLNGDYGFVSGLSVALEKRGVKQKDINAILYQNAVNYFYGVNAPSKTDN